ncbi:hypothetical protein LTR67_008748 [Exophiala xenobiotica]
MPKSLPKEHAGLGREVCNSVIIIKWKTSTSSIFLAPGPSQSQAILTQLARYSDEYCPNCDNHFVIDALTPKAALKVESEDTRMDARMLKDERVRQPEQQSIFDVKNAETRLV